MARSMNPFFLAGLGAGQQCAQLPALGEQPAQRQGLGPRTAQGFVAGARGEGGVGHGQQTPAPGPGLPAQVGEQRGGGTAADRRTIVEHLQRDEVHFVRG